MRPSIEFYNDLVSEEWTVSGIEREYPIITTVLPPDFNIYDRIVRLIMRQFKQLEQSKVFFIKDHNKAVDLLRGYTDVSLCNIDHHHDVGYEDTTPLTNIIRPDVGNWVKYLKDKKIVTNYTWIHNPNSTFPESKLDKYINNHYELQQIQTNQFDKQIDLLIICNSPEWIPSMYQPLFNILLNIAEEWYQTEFEIL